MVAPSIRTPSGSRRAIVERTGAPALVASLAPRHSPVGW
ncbi:hypothetical protein MBEHAL_0208 [Halarchaeum acidiphilum MH1-52-1]|uniref:Uncharacterized protein n=1 Tax=Halarchaeum acidiphilum MH1-52-1 TaxID=1261545 RepID=U3A9L0_9EURY|nr:hypothetical protein MBEHAL_0208 [Halarchaeum acidiphilum MH1-52-1]